MAFFKFFLFGIKMKIRSKKLNQICTTGNWNISPHGLWLDKQTLSDAGVLMCCCGSACFSFSPLYLFAVLLLISPLLWKRIIKGRRTLLTGSTRMCFSALFCHRGSGKQVGANEGRLQHRSSFSWGGSHRKKNRPWCNRNITRCCDRPHLDNQVKNQPLARGY